MKAEINERGTLVISAESPIESYALSQWHRGYQADPEHLPEDEKRFTSALCVVTVVVEDPA